MRPIAFALVALPLFAAGQDLPRVTPPPTRFALDTPFPRLDPLLLEVAKNRHGLAQAAAREHGLQGRVLWVDATANVGRVNSDENVRRVVQRAASAGFNTIVFDIKPISGHTMYPSRFAPKLPGWRNEVLPADYDPLAAMVRECRAAGLSILVSMNAFSEGHRIAQLNPPGPHGPGLDRPDLQTILYETAVTIRGNSVRRPEFRATDEANVPAPNDGSRIAVYTSVARLPVSPGEHVASVLDNTGKVQAQTTIQAIRALSVEIPTGGSVLVGYGPGADWLRMYAKPNDRMTFDHEPIFVPISERLSQQIPLIMNPHKAAVQDRMIAMVVEVLDNYDIDGIMFDDRLRFGGLNADFSPEARRLFEIWLGETVQWPDDVFRYQVRPDFSRGVIPGRHYDSWLVFKAMTIRDFMGRVRMAVDRAKPGTKLGVYVGSWYGEYTSFGSNFASQRFEGGFPFWSPSWQATGYAEIVDYIITGCYYDRATIAESMRDGFAPGITVEAAGQLSNRLSRDAAWTYAGIAISSYRGDREAFTRALMAAAATTQGVMVFDLSHEIEPLWPIFERAFAEPKAAPHMRSDLLAAVRRERRERDARGEREPPVVINGGIPGIGH